MAASYKGPHTIILNRNESNLGIANHVNRVFELANGELIVGSAGDDISYPERTERLVEAYQRSGKRAVLIHSDVVRIDQHGKTLGVSKPPVVKRNMTAQTIATSESIYIGASAAFSRAMIQNFKPMIFERSYEDLVWGFRAAILDSLLYVSEPLVKYRVGAGGIASLDVCSLKRKDFLSLMRNRRLVQIDVLKQQIARP